MEIASQDDVGVREKKVNEPEQMELTEEQEETDSNESSFDSQEEEEEEDQTWIQWYCSLRGNEFFCEVDEDYIQDDFNLTGLSQIVPMYDFSLDIILDVEDGFSASLVSVEQQDMAQQAAEMLYGLIHSRFVLTNKGLQQMAAKYMSVDFGRCPRVFCQGQPVLPVGQHDVARTSTVKVFCPRCEDIYYPRSARQGTLDGAYFGTTFPHLLLMTLPHLIPTQPEHSYVPRVYGFRVNKKAHQALYEAAEARIRKQKEENKTKTNTKQKTK